MFFVVFTRRGDSTPTIYEKGKGYDRVTTRARARKHKVPDTESRTSKGIQVDPYSPPRATCLMMNLSDGNETTGGHESEQQLDDQVKLVRTKGTKTETDRRENDIEKKYQNLF